MDTRTSNPFSVSFSQVKCFKCWEGGRGGNVSVLYFYNDISESIQWVLFHFILLQVLPEWHCWCSIFSDTVENTL